MEHILEIYMTGLRWKFK